MLKYLSINVFLIEGFKQTHVYVKFMKYMVTNRRKVCFEDDDQMKHCSASATRPLVQKK